MRSTLVARDAIGYILPQVEQYIRAAHDRPCDETADTVIQDLFTGDALLWVAHNGAGIKAAAVIRLLVVPNKRKICHIVCCGGVDMDEWIDCLSDIEKFARKNRCAVVRVSGRPGWKYKLKPRGYKEPFIFLDKDL